MNLLLTVVVIACALALLAVLLSRRAKVAEDGIAEFKRQLDALSPDASRPVIRPHQDLRPRDRDASETAPSTSEEDDDGA